MDRDGVLISAPMENGLPKSVRTLKELQVLDGVATALKIFRELEFIPIVITNQPNVSRGQDKIQNVDKIHNFLGLLLDLKYFYTCFHDDLDGCSCRKPKTGLLEKASQELNVSLANSILIGDRWKDIHAGQKVGAQCFFVDYSYKERRPVQPYTTVSSVKEVADVMKGF